MKNKIIIYVAMAVVIVILAILLVNTRKSADTDQVTACLESGGEWNMTTNTCVSKNSPSASNTSPNTVKTGSTQTATKPNIITVASSGKYTVHVSRGGSSVYYSPTTTVKDMIKVYNPPTNTVISSPLNISGEARGSWLTGGTSQVILTDISGRVLAQGSVKALNVWQTENFIAFLGTLTFPRQPTGSSGVLIVKSSANPSNAVEILVTF